MPDEQLQLEYSKITDLIYIGNSLCCTVHFEQKLINEGIRADISLDEEHLDSPWGAEFFLWLPVKDKTAPTQEQLKVGVAILTELVDSHIPTIVHCHSGHGRAPTLVAAYLIKQGSTPIGSGSTVKEAVLQIKQARPAIHLEGEQMAALENFYRQLASKNI